MENIKKCYNFERREYIIREKNHRHNTPFYVEARSLKKSEEKIELGERKFSLL